MKYYKKIKTYFVKYISYRGEEMEIGYQKDIDDLAIILTPKYKYSHSVEIDADFIIDIDKKDKIVAIEVVNCSKQLGVSKDYVEKAKKDVFVEIFDFSYKIIISFNDGEHEIIKRVLK